MSTSVDAKINSPLGIFILILKYKVKNIASIVITKNCVPDEIKNNADVKQAYMGE